MVEAEQFWMQWSDTLHARGVRPLPPWRAMRRAEQRALAKVLAAAVKRGRAPKVTCLGCHGSGFVGFDHERDVEIECHHCTDGTMSPEQVAEYNRAQRERAEWGCF